jgi:hypothetical protein
VRFAANGDAIAVNATGVEITPGCAPAFIEDATNLSTIRGDSHEQSISELHRRGQPVQAGSARVFDRQRGSNRSAIAGSRFKQSFGGKQ